MEQDPEPAEGDRRARKSICCTSRTAGPRYLSHVVLTTAVGLSIVGCGAAVHAYPPRVATTLRHLREAPARRRGKEPAVGGKPRAVPDHPQQPGRRGDCHRCGRHGDVYQPGGPATHGLERLHRGPRAGLWARSRDWSTNEPATNSTDPVDIVRRSGKGGWTFQPRPARQPLRAGISRSR